MPRKRQQNSNNVAFKFFILGATLLAVLSMGMHVLDFYLAADAIERQDFPEAERLSRQMLELEELIPGVSSRELTARVSLGRAIWHQHREDEAELVLKRGLELLPEARIDRDSIEAGLMIYATLGSLYLDQHRNSEAERCFLDATKFVERHWGTQNIGYVECLELLSNYYEVANDPTRLADYQSQRALILRDLNRFAEAATACSDTARTCATLRDFQQADAWHAEALRLAETQGADSIDLAAARLSYASTLGDRQEFAVAKSLVQPAIETYERHRDDEPARLLVALNNMAELHRKAGELDQAESFYQRVIELLPNHAPAKQATYWHNIGVLRFDQQRYAEAERLIADALDSQSDETDEDSRRLNIFLKSQVAVLEAQDRLDEAIPLLQRQLEVNASRRFPSVHAEFYIRWELCWALAAIGQTEEAEHQRGVAERLELSDQSTANRASATELLREAELASSYGNRLLAYGQLLKALSRLSLEEKLHSPEAAPVWSALSNVARDINPRLSDVIARDFERLCQSPHGSP